MVELTVWEEMPIATMGKHNTLRITAGECLVCDNGVIEFTGAEDWDVKYTHDEWAPFNSRYHIPVL